MNSIPSVHQNASKFSASSGIALEERVGRTVKELQESAVLPVSSDKFLRLCEQVFGNFLDDAKVSIFTAVGLFYEREAVRLPNCWFKQGKLIEAGYLDLKSMETSRSDPESTFYHWIQYEGVQLLLTSQRGDTNPFLLFAVTPETEIALSPPEMIALLQLSELVERLLLRCLVSFQREEARKIAELVDIAERTGHALRNPLSSLDALSVIVPTQWNDREFLREFAKVVPGATRQIQDGVERLIESCRQIQRKKLVTSSLPNFLNQTESLKRSAL